MARKRAVKRRLDLRKGGLANRNRFQTGGLAGILINGEPFSIGKDPAPYLAEAKRREAEAAKAATTTTTDTATTANTATDTTANTATDTATDTTANTTTDTATEQNKVAEEPKFTVAKTTTGFGKGEELTGDASEGIEIRTELLDKDIKQDASKSRIEDREKLTAPDKVTVDKIDAAQVEDVAQIDDRESLEAAKMEAAKAGDLETTKAAEGQVTREAVAEAPEFTEANKVETAVRDAQQEEAALAKTSEFKISDDAFVKEVTGKTVDVVQTSAAEKNEREAVVGMPAPSGEEAEIINEFNFGSSKNRVRQGEEAKKAASDRLVSEYGITKEIADSILEDVGQLATDIDGVPQDALGAVASLPKAALVSSQMESLLAGMEDGKIPTWARAAVAGVEQRLAERGLEASTIGREALFNAIIQSTIPIAQSNATALQQRASQNLSSEQQALLQDRQLAADFLSKNAAFKQQMELANLSNDQQMRLANLTALNQAGSENLSAAQQTELANLNAQMQTNLLQSKLAQEMGIAQLNVDQQRAIQNASMVANVDMTKFTTEQQVELANSKFMQSMTMASFNAEQQSAIQNATTLASMDLAAADQRTKLAITNAQNFLQMDMANLSNTQQALIMDQQLAQQRLLSDQSFENAARQFNATSENQTQQFMESLAVQIENFNAAQLNAMAQFNTTEENRIEQVNAGNDLEADKFDAQLKTNVELADAQRQDDVDKFNAQNEQLVEQANADWERKANTIDTAAQNEANKLAAQMTYNMSQAEQNFFWQQMRDAAAFEHQEDLTEKERAMTILSSILGNGELLTSKRRPSSVFALINRLESLLGF